MLKIKLASREGSMRLPFKQGLKHDSNFSTYVSYIDNFDSSKITNPREISFLILTMFDLKTNVWYWAHVSGLPFKSSFDW